MESEQEQKVREQNRQRNPDNYNYVKVLIQNDFGTDVTKESKSGLKAARQKPEYKKPSRKKHTVGKTIQV